MFHETEMFCLSSRTAGASAPVLSGVQASGRLDGVLFELALRQTYRNSSDEPLEVVYTFPLPTAAVLLGFASELDGVRQESLVVEKRQAQRRYEAALEDGDAPVMLEARRDGIHTANIGNLKPGQEIVLELRFAQVLVVEQGRLRLALPMTIAPRYGAPAAAGLEPQQVPVVDVYSRYPLSLSVDVTGPLAEAEIECPTHPMTRTQVEGGLRFALAQGASLDRDLVLLLTPGDPQLSLQIQSPDVRSPAAPRVVMAVLQPPVAPAREHIALKLLVDCSGSMAGDSLASAKAALIGLLGQMRPQDYLSLTRFGTQVDPQLRMVSCGPQSLALATAKVQAMASDLGGTEMAQALNFVMHVPVPRACAGADVLLLTDGEVWEVRDMIRLASRSAHRIFVIGVGASPAEAPLRALAEATGGACEFATPGEHLEAAAARMLTRIRQHPPGSLRIDWGAAAPVWQTTLPRGVFGGDMVVACAGFAPGTEPSAVQLWADGDGDDALPQPPQLLAAAPAGREVPTDTLARLAAQRRLLQDETLVLPLALTYQLLSERTNCLLVHQRAPADQVIVAATMHRVPSMLAAGWGALGSVSVAPAMAAPMMARSMPGASAALGDDELVVPSVWRTNRIPASASAVRTIPPTDAADWFDASDMGDLLGLSFGGKASVAPEATLGELARAVVQCLAQSADVAGLEAHLQAQGFQVPAAVLAALREVEAAGAPPGVPWLLLARWLQAQGSGPADEQAEQVLVAALAGVDAQWLAVCQPIFERHLAGDAPHGDEASASARSRRIRRALGQAG